MKIQVRRKIYSTQSTIGELSINGVFECYTLEDPVRPKKIPAVTAIPAGRYQVEINHSPRFGRDLPLLLDVPEFEGIRIHWGNTAAHTEGCLLVGTTKAVDFIGNSRAAFQALFLKIVAAQDEVSLEIIDEGISPFLEASAEDLSAEGTHFRVLADPLRLRSSTETRNRANVVALLPFGAIVVQIGQAKSGWVRVRTEVSGMLLEGFVARSYLEIIPHAVVVGPVKESELWRVKPERLNLRSTPGDMREATILAQLPRGLLVSKLGISKKSLWWEVEARLQGSLLRGFVHSSLLERDLGPAVTGSSVSSLGQSGVQVTETALQLILEFEGLDQPGKWPGGQSGVTLGIGYDLGFCTEDEFYSDWAEHLSSEVMQRLCKALGKSGATAKRLAPTFADIKISRKIADEVFVQRTIPKHSGITARTFPGITQLPPDAQGALVSLVFNRGAAMHSRLKGDPRREMREIRDLVQHQNIEMPLRLEEIAASLERMCRLWQGKGLGGLIRRRKAEAALVRSCV